MAFDGSTLLAATSGTFIGATFSDSFTVSGNDVDMIALELTAGSLYTVDVDHGVAGDTALRIFDQFGAEVRANDDGFRSTDDVPYSLSPYVEFVPNYSGVYYFAVAPYYLQRYNPNTTAGRSAPENPLPLTTGTLTVVNFGTAIWPSAGSIGGIASEDTNDETDVFREDDRQLRVTYFGAVDSATDVDMARIDLAKGDVVVVDVNGLEGNGTVLRIFDDNGVQIGFDDDSGTGEDPELIFTAPNLNDFYIGISGEGNFAYSALNGSGTVAGAVGDFEVIIHRNPTQIGSSLSNLFTGGDLADYIVALAGNDTVIGGIGNDTLAGGDDNDSLTGGLGNDVLYGEGGNDTLLGGQNHDVLVGGIGNDLLDGSIGNDVLDGGAGSDTLRGRDGADTLYGGAGDDTLASGDANDTLYGGSENDSLAGGDGDDLVFGGSGDDLITDSAGNDTMFGDSGIDRLFGGIGNDLLDGGFSNDTLGGGAGNDTVIGGSGNDSLVGGNGNDRLIGGLGTDTLRGGTGNDEFVFASTSEGLDLILDFGLIADDRIDLSAIFDGTGSVVTGANLAQFVQVTAAGVADTFLGVDADGAVGGLTFTVIAQIVGVTPVQLFDVDNFIL